MRFSIKKLSNIGQRVIAGLIGAAVVITGVCFNQWSFFALFFFICLFSLYEFYKLVRTSEVKPNATFGIASGITLYTLFYLVESGICESKIYYSFLPILFFLFIAELFKKSEKPFHNLAYTYLGIFYVALPFSLLHSSAFAFSTYHYEIILGILFLIWGNDIGGYFSGMLFGKTKLFPRVSPKKTWEGTIGGAILSVITGFTFSLFFTQLSSLEWIIMSLVLVVVGSFGDLVESLLKRSLTVKDSGNIIPGHGGFLDRFDSLILSAPFIAAFIKFIA